MLGWVPELRPLYETATVVIAPLRAGKGTRLKLLEAAAEGVAIVSTRAAAHGLPHTPCWAWLADDEHSLADACATALKDPDERQRRRCREGSRGSGIRPRQSRRSVDGAMAELVEADAKPASPPPKSCP